MSKLVFIIIGVVCCSFSARAQSQPAPPQTPRASLFDSYDRINSEDLMARLDNLAIELQNQPTVRTHILVYGPKGDGGGTGKTLLKASIDYLVNARGVEAARLSGDYGGRYKDPAGSLSELWMIPAGAEPPAAKTYESKVGQLNGKFAEYDTYDFGGPPDCEGPCLGDFTIAGFADALREQPQSVAYLVASNQKGAKIGVWRRVAKQEADNLQSRGIAADRIKIIFAGTAKSSEDTDPYPDQARLQLWILPRDAPPPAREAAPEEIPKVSTQLGLFDEYGLKSPEVEKRAFEGFADVLKANANLGLCIIARPPLTPGFHDPEITPVENEPPDIDFKTLLDKWKDKLAKDYQIESRRIFIIMAAAGENNAGTIETWIVPPGASLPDPYASDPDDPPVDELREF